MTHQPIAILRRALLAVALAAPLGGCMTSSPIWEEHFSEAVRTSMQAQIIDPDAAQHASPAQGIDGKAAAAAMAVYDKSYQQPPAAENAYSMGVSSSTGH